MVRIQVEKDLVGGVAYNKLSKEENRFVEPKRVGSASAHVSYSIAIEGVMLLNLPHRSVIGMYLRIAVHC